MPCSTSSIYFMSSIEPVTPSPGSNLTLYDLPSSYSALTVTSLTMFE